MHRILLLLVGLILVACSSTAILEPAQPSATPTVPTQTPLPPSITPTVATPTPSITPSVTASNSPFPSITPFIETATPLAPEVTPTSAVGLWRVRHDVERDDWNFKSRLWVKDWKQLRGLPETVRINGGRGTVTLPEEWVEFLDRINTTDAQRYLRKLQSGWLNYGPFPKMEQLTFGGNYVYVTRVKGNRAFIRTYNIANAPPQREPYTEEPDPLIQLFSVVYTDGSWQMETPVGIAYTLILANPNDDPLWIDMDDLTRRDEPTPSPTPSP
jgi:hypothetical protein